MHNNNGEAMLQLALCICCIQGQKYSDVEAGNYPAFPKKKDRNCYIWHRSLLEPQRFIIDARTMNFAVSFFSGIGIGVSFDRQLFMLPPAIRIRYTKNSHECCDRRPSSPKLRPLRIGAATVATEVAIVAYDVACAKSTRNTDGEWR